MGRSFIVEQLANWCVDTSYSSLPDNVRLTASRAIFDTVGVITAGGQHPLVQRINNMTGDRAGPSMAVGGRFVSPQVAALTNGTAAHVYDFDDTSYTGIMHGSAVILPTILAIANEIQSSQEDLITAFVAGSEVTYALAESLTHSHYFKGWWSTGTLGLIGAAAAAGKLYDLNADKMASAIGLAVAGASGTKAIVGTDGKAFFVGDAARRAVDFAKAAAVGIRGPFDAVESNRGFASLLNDGTINSNQINSIGQHWRLIDPGLLFKRYPVCSAAHAIIELTATLAAEAQCSEADVAEVICEIPELTNISLVYDTPLHSQQAQFSAPFAIACALRHGAVKLKDLSEETITDPRTRDLMNRVKKRIEPELSTDEMRHQFPESARITLVLKDGRQFLGFCGEAYGMPRRPLSDEDLIGKFRNCLHFSGQDPALTGIWATELLVHKETAGDRRISDIVNDIWTLPSQLYQKAETAKEGGKTRIFSA